MKYIISPSDMVRKYEPVKAFKEILDNSAEIEYPNDKSPFPVEYKGKEMKSSLVSDGIHSFDELYAHRNRLFLELARIVQAKSKYLMAWCSFRYNDDTVVEEGWFLMGIFDNRDPVVMKDISYHLPMSLYQEAISFCEEMAVAPEFDGYDSYDVLQRLCNVSK